MKPVSQQSCQKGALGNRKERNLRSSLKNRDASCLTAGRVGHDLPDCQRAVGAVPTTDWRSGTHRKWIGMGHAAVNTEITFSSSLEKSVGASASPCGRGGGGGRARRKIEEKNERRTPNVERGKANEEIKPVQHL